MAKSKTSKNKQQQVPEQQAPEQLLDRKHDDPQAQQAPEQKAEQASNGGDYERKVLIAYHWIKGYGAFHNTGIVVLPRDEFHSLIREGKDALMKVVINLSHAGEYNTFKTDPTKTFMITSICFVPNVTLKI